MDEQKDKVLEIANQNNRILLTKQITDAGIYRSTLQVLEADGKIIRVQHSVYVTTDILTISFCYNTGSKMEFNLT